MSTTLGVTSALSAGGPWWMGFAVPVAMFALWGGWKFSASRLGVFTGAAAVSAVAFVVFAALFAAPTICPLTDGTDRCTAAEVTQGGFAGLLISITLLILSVIAVAAWSAIVAGALRVPAVASAMSGLVARVERDRRVRRDRGVRWVRSDWRRDPVVWSAAAGTAAGAVAGWLLGSDVSSAVMWAVGGFLAAGGVPAAWRAGTAARTPRKKRHR